MSDRVNARLAELRERHNIPEPPIGGLWLFAAAFSIWIWIDDFLHWHAPAIRRRPCPSRLRISASPNQSEIRVPGEKVDHG